MVSCLVEEGAVYGELFSGARGVYGELFNRRGESIASC